MITYLLKGFILGFPNAGVPGPFQAYLLLQTMKVGPKRALPVALAPLLSDGPIVVLVLFVLTRLEDNVLGMIQTTGGLFILYLAYGAFCEARKTPEKPDMETGARQQAGGVLKGALMNALNPAPYIFWSTVGGPILLQGMREATAWGVAFLLGFYGTLIGGFCALICIFGKAKGLSPRASKVMSTVSGLALLLFGIWQLTVGAYAAFGVG